MGQDTVLHITIGLIVAIMTGVFTAGGAYIYVQMAIKQLQKDAEETHLRLDKKMDKNFETLDTLIDENKKELLSDLAGIGGKISRVEATGSRRHINTMAAILIAAPQCKEHDIALLMKEVY